METKMYEVVAAHSKEWMYSDRSEVCSNQPTLEVAWTMACYYLTEQYRINSMAKGRSFDSPGRNLGYSFVVENNVIIAEYTIEVKS